MLKGCHAVVDVRPLYFITHNSKARSKSMKISHKLMVMDKGMCFPMTVGKGVLWNT